MTSGESALRFSGRSSVTTPTAPSRDSNVGTSAHLYSGISALMPVAWRPMISFWICDVPS